MSRQSAATLALAALVGLAGGTAPARGAPMTAVFRLKNLDAADAAPAKEVLALVLPTAAVVPYQKGGPPTIVPASSGYASSGFRPGDLQVTLGNGTVNIPAVDGANKPILDATGKPRTTPQPFEAIKLDFGAAGFRPGGTLYLQLNLAPTFDPGLSNLVRLVLPTDVKNLAMETLGVGAPILDAAPQTVTIPEPVPVFAWLAALLALGLVRARAFVTA